MSKLLVANWKENPKTEASALRLFGEIAKATKMPRNTHTTSHAAKVVVCPPFVYLEEIANAFRKMKTDKSLAARKNLALGAQDIFWQDRGAYTSEVGPKMIRTIGARYVIVGHSERRKYLKETDSMINKKIKLALKDGLNVVLCVGEPLAVREQGIKAAERFIKNQLKKDLVGVRGVAVRSSRIHGSARGCLIIAYEPIWAIGTGRNDKPEDVVTMANFIKKTARTANAQGLGFPRFLYGGSVNSKNIADYVQYKEIDGALVGGASLQAAEFGKMAAIINHKKL